jgi:hypothetical protein
MPPKARIAAPDTLHDGRLVAALVKLTSVKGELVWSHTPGDDRYIGRLNGSEVARVVPNDAGQWELWVGRRLVDHPNVQAFIESIDAPFTAATKSAEQLIIDRANQ